MRKSCGRSSSKTLGAVSSLTAIVTLKRAVPSSHYVLPENAAERRSDRQAGPPPECRAALHGEARDGRLRDLGRVQVHRMAHRPGPDAADRREVRRARAAA